MNKVTTTSEGTISMNRFPRYFALFIGALIILAGLVAAYLLTGASSAQTRLHYTLAVPEPSAKNLSVTLTIQPDPTPFLDLYLRDPVQDGRRRVIGFKVERNGKPVFSWQTLPFFPDAIRLWNGFSMDPVTITYQVDPLWMKGENSPRSYLGNDFAYIRGMVTLYSTLSVRDLLNRNFDQPGIEAGFAEADVTLPPGWEMVSPFGSGKISIPVAYLRNAYFGFGPFDLQDITIKSTSFLLGVYQGLPPERQDTLSRQIPILFQTMQKMTGFAPVSHTCYWSLAVLPTEPIHGGASGTGSLVVEDNVNIIAHEMFHWWDGATLITTSDANWLKEGFTTYYAAKSLYASGLWTNDEFSSEIGRFQKMLWKGAPYHAINILDASNRLVNQNDPDAYDVVFYGGGLLAYQLDQLLKAQGKSLDALWPILGTLNHPVSSEDFLDAFETVGGADLARQARDILHGQEALNIQKSVRNQ